MQSTSPPDSWLKPLLLGVCLVLPALICAVRAETRDAEVRQGAISRTKPRTRGRSPADARCAPELVNVPRYGKPKKFHFEKGERYRHSAYVSFKVDENGSVSQPSVVRSTGVKDVDNYLLKAVKGWKYKPAPGCGTRDAEADLTVDFY